MNKYRTIFVRFYMSFSYSKERNSTEIFACYADRRNKFHNSWAENLHLTALKTLIKSISNLQIEFWNSKSIINEA